MYSAVSYSLFHLPNTCSALLCSCVTIVKRIATLHPQGATRDASVLALDMSVAPRGAHQLRGTAALRHCVANERSRNNIWD